MSNSNKWLLTQSVVDVLRMFFVMFFAGLGSTDGFGIVHESKPTTARLGCMGTEMVFAVITGITCLGWLHDRKKGIIHAANAVIAGLSLFGAALLLSDLDDTTLKPEIGMCFIAFSLLGSKLKDFAFAPVAEGGVGYPTGLKIDGDATGNNIASPISVFCFCPCPGSIVNNNASNAPGRLTGETPSNENAQGPLLG